MACYNKRVRESRGARKWSSNKLFKLVFCATTFASTSGVLSAQQPHWPYPSERSSLPTNAPVSGNLWSRPQAEYSTIPSSPWRETLELGSGSSSSPSTRTSLIRQPSRSKVSNRGFGQSPSFDSEVSEEIIPLPIQENLLLGPEARVDPRSIPRSSTSANHAIANGNWQRLPSRGMVLEGHFAESHDGHRVAEPQVLAESRNQPTTEHLASAANGPRILPPQKMLSGAASHSSGAAIVGATFDPLSASILTSMEQERTSRERLASEISQNILTKSELPQGSNPRALEAPPGWQAIENELRTRLRNCDLMLRRSATRSGRQEAITAIRLLTRNLDLRRGDWVSEPALDAALLAFKEERDFFQPVASTSQVPSTQSIVDGHQTPVLKSLVLDGVSPELASQYYRAFARERLIEAADQHPWAADLYYALGKSFEKQAIENRVQSSMLRGQAVVCYQAALSTTPNHADAATQLSYVLLQLDRVSEAEEVIAVALQLRNRPEDWRNLAEIYRRQNNSAGQLWASQRLRESEATAGNRSPFPPIHQVAPDDFVRISPYVERSTNQSRNGDSIHESVTMTLGPASDTKVANSNRSGASSR